MLFTKPRRRREFKLRRSAEQEETRKGRRFEFRPHRRKPPMRIANLLWLIVLLIVVMLMVRYLHTFNW
jgi:hypothetical protein